MVSKRVDLFELLKHPDPKMKRKAVTMVAEAKISELYICDPDSIKVTEEDSPLKIFYAGLCEFLQRKGREDAWERLLDVFETLKQQATTSKNVKILQISKYFLQNLKTFCKNLPHPSKGYNEKLEDAVKLLRDFQSDLNKNKTDKNVDLIILISIQIYWMYFKLFQYKNAEAQQTSVRETLKNERFSFSKSSEVSMLYYEGRLALLESKMGEAYEKLDKGLNLISKRVSDKNKRQILKYIIPVWVYHGIFPPKKFLVDNNLSEYITLVSAVKKGNIGMFKEEVQRLKRLLIKRGLFLIMEKFQLILYRNLFKKVYALIGNNPKTIETQLLQKAVIFSSNNNRKTAVESPDKFEENIELNEIECIVAMLIHKKYIRGYIYHEKRKIVLSVDERGAFPPLMQVVNKQF